jgi:hypothetical protein
MTNLNLPSRSPPTSTLTRATAKPVALLLHRASRVKGRGYNLLRSEGYQGVEDRGVRQVLVHSEPFAVEQKDGRYIVTSRLTGNFRGARSICGSLPPRARKIASLEIAPELRSAARSARW